MGKILVGHVLDVLRGISSESVDCVVTSPPYWGLRVYGTEAQIWGGDSSCPHSWDFIKPAINHKAGETNPCKEAHYKESLPETSSFCSKCGAWRGELGNEPDFNLYLKHLMEIFKEVKRVLKLTGTCFVNLGDTYSGSGCVTKDYRTGKSKSINGIGKNKALYKTGGIAQRLKAVPSKSLCLIPNRFAIQMVDDGWICRNEIIWHKLNCLPQSVKDRFTVDFEKIFFFTKSGKYSFDQQFEPKKEVSKTREKRGRGESHKNIKIPGQTLQGLSRPVKNDPDREVSDSRNMRCVWSIPTKGFKGAHFAVFPEKLVEVMVKSGCPSGGLVLAHFLAPAPWGLWRRRMEGII